MKNFPFLTFSPVQNTDLPEKPISFHNEKEQSADIHDVVSQDQPIFITTENNPQLEIHDKVSEETFPSPPPLNIQLDYEKMTSTNSDLIPKKTLAIVFIIVSVL